MKVESIYLWFWGHASNFHPAEAEIEESYDAVQYLEVVLKEKERTVYSFSVFVKACCQSYRVGNF